ncbi:MAG: HAMP domain-containing protein, partial [Nitrospira sp.]
MRFKDVPIGLRVGGGFAALVLGMAVVAGSGWQGLNRVQQNVRAIYEDAVVLEADFGIATTALLRYRNLVIQSVGAASVEDFKEFSGELPGLKDLAEQTLRSAAEKLKQASADSEAATKQVTALTEALAAYWGLDKRTIDQTRASWNAAVPADAERLRNAAKQNAFFTAGPALDAAAQALSEIQGSLREGAMGQYVAATEAGRRATRTLWAVLLISGVLAVILGLVIVRGVTVPVAHINSVFSEIERGDLTRPLTYDGRDEMGTLCRNLNRFVERLNLTLCQVSEAATTVRTAAEHLSSATLDVEKGSEIQAATAVQASAAAEQVAATVTEVARSAQEAAAKAALATQASRTGAEVAGQAIAGMQAIAATVQEAAQRIGTLGARSKEISAIVKVINDIADQTNLLALNAAIEAARAGEQGRGFAVVADEVRKLAERTSHATKEIGSMIQGIQQDTDGAVHTMQVGTKTTEAAVQKVNQAGERLAVITS